ncbi:DJ-1/PfpI family protein [Occultella glacieicola]|uniref:DJ-1/PfpI family protein n=1 Tax=Occultella glacieicola TaxID=2518684 RepID=UPI001F2D22E1|nr:DJ-1/PfpI family protein [Occultella glacieicola]
MTTASPIRVGILVFDGVDELDVVGPHRVLSTWAARSALRPDVVLFSRDGLPVRSATGLDLVPSLDSNGTGTMHVLIHPGGPGARRLSRDRDHLAWLRRTRRGTALLAGLGTGSLALAAAGLLAGRATAVHPDARAALLGLEPSALLDVDSATLDDGDLLTCAGGVHGIDLALAVVERYEGAPMAATVRGTLTYDPGP